MFKHPIPLMFGFALALAGGCDKDDDNGTGTDGGSGGSAEGGSAGEGCGEGGEGGEGGEVDQCALDYAECQQQMCATEYEACYGDGYASGNFSGPCGPFLECSQDCGCDSTCAMGCTQHLMTMECQSCSIMLATCASNSCLPAYMECMAG